MGRATWTARHVPSGDLSFVRLFPRHSFPWSVISVFLRHAATYLPAVNDHSAVTTFLFTDIERSSRMSKGPGGNPAGAAESRPYPARRGSSPPWRRREAHWRWNPRGVSGSARCACGDRGVPDCAGGPGRKRRTPASRALRDPRRGDRAARRGLFRWGGQSCSAHHECGPWRPGADVAVRRRTGAGSAPGRHVVARSGGPAPAGPGRRRTRVPVTASGLRPSFPALRSLEAVPNNLPQQVTTFIGREREQEQVKAALRRPGYSR